MISGQPTARLDWLLRRADRAHRQAQDAELRAKHHLAEAFDLLPVGTVLDCRWNANECYMLSGQGWITDGLGIVVETERIRTMFVGGFYFRIRGRECDEVPRAEGAGDEGSASGNRRADQGEPT